MGLIIWLNCYLTNFSYTAPGFSTFAFGTIVHEPFFPLTLSQSVTATVYTTVTTTTAYLRESSPETCPETRP